MSPDSNQSVEKLMYFSLCLSDLKAPPCRTPLPKKVGEIVVVDLGTYLHWLITGQLVPYTNNRGDGHVSTKTSQDVRDGVWEDALGLSTIGYYKGQLCQADWHSRTFGLLQRYADNNLSREEMGYKIAVKLISEETFVKTYCKLNGADIHHTKDKIKNPDLVYGQPWDRIRNALSEDCNHMVGDNKWTVVSSIMYALANGLTPENPEWEHLEVYGKRQQAMRLANNLPGEGLKTARLKPWEPAIVEGIQYWYELMMALKAEAGKLNVSKFTSSAGFFSFIVISKMAGVLPARNKTLVNRILRNYNKISPMLNELCRGSHAEIVRNSRKMKEILRGKERVA